MAHVLGISAYYHDSAAALLCDGRLCAAAQEERFTRAKHYAGFPAHAVAYCLSEAGIGLGDVQKVVFYEKPMVTFERLLETYLSYAPRGFGSFAVSMPVWVKEKLFLKSLLRRELRAACGCKGRLPQLLFTEHHQSHAAASFYPSPFRRAAVLCLDAVGEWATTSLWLGEDEHLSPLWQLDFPHSLGMLYSAFTYFTGFRVNSGEYKLMGLAPYGKPRYADTIRDSLIDIRDDGTFRLNMDYFGFATSLRMTNRRFAGLFGGPPRVPEGPLTQREMDLAASVQSVTEDIVLRLGRTAQRETGAQHVCLGGGVALNCVANGRLLREGPFSDVWIQPAAGDAGGAVGAAYAAWHQYLGNPRTVASPDAMQGAYLGPSFTSDQARQELDEEGAVYTVLDPSEVPQRVARLLAEQRVVGWFQGRMEFGPRALGSRSILGDARSPEMQSLMNLKIKFRESFRPFAPVVLAEKVQDYFEHSRPSPYMLMTSKVQDGISLAVDDRQDQTSGLAKLKVPRSTIPAVTHVDWSARLQTVHRETNPRFHALISAFEALTGVAVLVNTSFNVRGEPIVCSPRDAFRCFMRTEMDYLVVGDYLLAKEQQTVPSTSPSIATEFELD